MGLWTRILDKEKKSIKDHIFSFQAVAALLFGFGVATITGLLPLEWWVVALFVVLLPPTLLKIAFKGRDLEGVQVSFPLIMLSTKKGLSLLDKFVKHRNLIALIADLGTILGLGTIGYWFVSGGKKLRTITCFFCLCGFFLGLTYLLGFPAGLSLKQILLVLSGAIGGISFFSVYVLFEGALDIVLDLFLGQRATPTVSPIIPGVHVEGAPFIPLYGIISLLIIVFIHELSHGAAARAFGVKIKSAGALLLGFLPIGAFVEPDEKDLVQKPRLDRMRVYSIAATINIIAGLGIGAILFASLSVLQPQLEPMTTELSQGVNVSCVFSCINSTESLCDDSCSHFPGLKKGMIITSIGNDSISATQDLYLVLQSYPVNTTMDINTSEGVVSGVFTGKLGFYPSQVTGEVPFDYQMFSILLQIIFLTAWLSVAVGMMNFFPVSLFDGGRMVSEIAELHYKRKGFGSRKVKRCTRKVTMFIGLFCLALILVGMIPLFFNHPPTCACI